MTDPDTLEEGDIFFLYRPLVDVERPHDLSEVQHLYVVLRPRGAGRFRLLVIGKKRLPTGGGNDRNWGFVEQIAADGAAIEAGLREQHYETKTAGERTQGAARPAGEGTYALRRSGGEIHLLYALALPEQTGPVQDALGVASQAALNMSVKNPDVRSGNSGMLERHEPGYSAEELTLFGGNRWAPADPRLLDRRGAEFLLTAVDDDAADEMDAHPPADEARARSFTQLRLARTRHPVEPLFTGEWA